MLSEDERIEEIIKDIKIYIHDYISESIDENGYNRYEIGEEEQEFFNKIDTVLNLITKLQKENKQKDKQIDLMAEYISKHDIDEDICKEQADNNCDDINREAECKDCIKQYFERKARDGRD